MYAPPIGAKALMYSSSVVVTPTYCASDPSAEAPKFGSRLAVTCIGHPPFH